MAEKLPITDVAELVIFGIKTGEMIEGLSDGIGLEDSLDVIEVMKLAPAAIKGFDKILPQLKDMDAAELEIIKEEVKKLDLGDDKLEAYIEFGLNRAMALALFAKDTMAELKAIKAMPEAKEEVKEEEAPKAE